MKKLFITLSFCWLAVFLMAQSSTAKLEPLDIFELEYVSDPQISPDGQEVVYVRNFKDIMTDGNLSNLWKISFEGADHEPLTTGDHRDYAPLWSPDGKRLLYISTRGGKPQLYLRWTDSGAEAKLTNLNQAPSDASWSPDGNWIAFTMFVPESAAPFIKMPAKPAGAQWNDPAIYIDKLKYRSDGAGYLKDGYTQLFVLSAEGGTPRQLTTGPYNHSGTPSWSADGKSLVFAANRNDDGEYDPANTEVYRVNIASGEITSLTERRGPDNSPVVSPNGLYIAYLGYDDKYLGYQQNKLYVMNSDGTDKNIILKKFDRDISQIKWSGNGNGLFFLYDNEGNTKIGYVTLNGQVKELTNNVGGLSLGRPYSGGSFSVSINGSYAFTHSQPSHPADLATGRDNQVLRITKLNDDLFSHKKLGSVEEIWYTSSYDNQKIQGWICKPPDFDSTRQYPLLLEIHGGPFANYGDRFSAEVQLYAAAGYVVLYTNPRGSSGYGAKFGNLIHHNYPNQDYDDLISGVDALIAKGYIDSNNLFVTGGSGGGVLSSWIIGKTDRFRAAVVAKPVINWYSFVLHSDNPAFFYKYWFPGFPWEYQEEYMKRSPISLVGNVSTPTMLLTGEEDFRTPMSETEQYYAALKLRKVEAVMVRIPGAGHGIAAKPSNLISKVLHVLGWFDKHKVGV